ADIEEIAVRGFAEEVEDALVGGVAVFEAGHAVDDPGARPAGAAAAVGEAGVERGAAGFGQLRRAARGDLVSGEERPEVGDVAVAGLVVGVVFGPFLQAAVAGDFEWRE